MRKRRDEQARGRYTLEFKFEAVRLVNAGQAVAVVAKILGVPVQTLGNWVRLSEKGQIKGAGDKPSRAWTNKRISDEALLVHTKAIHAEVKEEYGWPRMCKELLARGIRVGKELVRKLTQCAPIRLKNLVELSG